MTSPNYNPLLLLSIIINISLTFLYDQYPFSHPCCEFNQASTGTPLVPSVSPCVYQLGLSVTAGDWSSLTHYTRLMRSEIKPIRRAYLSVETYGCMVVVHSGLASSRSAIQAFKCLPHNKGSQQEASSTGSPGLTLDTLGSHKQLINHLFCFHFSIMLSILIHIIYVCSQYHICWCPGDISRQGINRYDIDPQPPGYILAQYDKG